ncbi:hypothetical protein BXZ70DRAFT_1067466 [Cristinia sonorae]|uniref:BTB domain-containing protein n=1 Tax=Cristinia sonorae TaxID=1940300 RepID=A0A8K0XLK4_9AGAR|nr:hypothetical protein BXZ70DRAFT_1067466 [Cristinia sonorae]
MAPADSTGQDLLHTTSSQSDADVTRPRSESSLTSLSPQTAFQFQPSAEVWYNDGTIILVAGDTGFRVYAGILSEQSPVFSELLSEIPGHTPQNATFDGSPLLWLPDHPKEMQYLLKAIHCTRFVVDPELDFNVLCGILHLSTLYRIPHLRLRAILALQHYFPPTLDEWLNAKTSRQKLSASDIFHLANVARTTDASALLVSVLTWCAGQPLDHILEGVTAGPRTEGPHVTHFDQINLLAVLRARPQLHRLAYSTTLQDVFISISCVKTRCLLMKRILGSKLIEGRETDGFLNPLWSYRPLSTLHPQVLCEMCRRELTQSVETGSRCVWEKLPGIFGLECWNGLETPSV